MTIEEIRSNFPQLQEKVYGKPLVYLDNAATTMRLNASVAKWNEVSLHANANLHRAVHYLANIATEEFESTRKAVSDYLGADSSEIVFTSGTTASLNLLAFCIGESSLLKEGDEILIAESEHHSDIVPWQMLAQRKGLKIKALPVDDNGEISLPGLKALLSARTRLCCIAQVSNVLGIVNPIKEIAQICHEAGCFVSVDGAQAIAHMRVDVKDLDCDFYSFSAHKIFAAPGVGVLYGRKTLLEQLPPWQGGGEMIETVKWGETTYSKAPHRFEAGTQNISGVPALKPALEFLKDILSNKESVENQENIKAFLLEELPKIEGLKLYGQPADPSNKIPLFSFSIEGVHHEDLALILDKMGIAVRSGQMCAEPLMDRFGVTGMLRASFSPYNTLQEAQYFTDSLKKAVTILK